MLGSPGVGTPRQAALFIPVLCRGVPAGTQGLTIFLTYFPGGAAGLNSLNA